MEMTRQNQFNAVGPVLPDRGLEGRVCSEERVSALRLSPRAKGPERLVRQQPDRALFCQGRQLSGEVSNRLRRGPQVMRACGIQHKQRALSDGHPIGLSLVAAFLGEGSGVKQPKPGMSRPLTRLMIAPDKYPRCRSE